VAAESNALREVFARFGVAFDTGPLTRGNSAVNDVENALRGLGNVIAGAAVVQGIRYFTADIAAMGTELRNTALATGLSTDELQTWRAAAGAAGVAAEQFTPAIQTLRRNAENASHGAGPAVRDFYRLGITLRDSSGHLRTTDDLLQRTIEGLAGVQDPTRRTAMAMRLLGESGARLGPLFANGAEGVAEARRQIDLLGGGLSEEAIEASAEYTAQTRALDQAFTSLRGRIALFFLPALAAANQAFSRTVGGISRLADHSRLLQAAVATLGAAAVIAGTRTAVSWALAAAPFVALGVLVLGLILLVDDLWTGLAGGNSVLLDLGQAFETWSAGVTEGPLRAVLDMIETIFGGIREIAAFGFDAAGDITGDRSLNRDAAGLRSEGLAPTVDRLTDPAVAARATGALGTGPSADALVAGLGRRAAPAAPTTIDRSVRIGAINTTGLTAAAAESMVARAVTRAMDADTDETADALAIGGS
jgi:hypothetical protein